MKSESDWMAQEFSFWCGDSPEFHALMAELSDDVDQALRRQAMPVTEDELIRAGAAFIMGGGE
jgi:hypothetical protein